MATNNFIGDLSSAALSEWNTATNWSLGHVPLSTEDTTFTGIPASPAPAFPMTITTTNAVAKSVDFSTAGAAFTLSGSPYLIIYGSLTCKTGMTWNHTGRLYVGYYSPGILTSNSVSFVNAISVRNEGSSLTLADTLTCSQLFVFTSATFSTGVGNNIINCTTFGDNTITGAVTLTLGTSTINCTNVSFAAATLTVNHTGIVNLTTVAAGLTTSFGQGTVSGTGWGTVNYLATPTAAAVYALQFPATAGANLITLNLSYAADRRDGSFTINNAFTLATSSIWKGGGVGFDDPTIRPLIGSSAIGTVKTITVSAASQTLTFTDVDFRDIEVATTNTPTITGTRVGDCGGNTNVDTDAPKTVYSLCGSSNKNWYNNVWEATRGGGVSLNNFPLPQDTAIIDDGTFSSASVKIATNYPRISGIDASGLTETNIIDLFTDTYYGSLIFTGGGLSVLAATLMTIDARVASTLSINATISLLTSAITIDSYGGTVRLLTNNLTHTGTFTLTRGTFDLNGLTLSTNAFSSSNANTRTLQDSVGGGKIIVTGVTGAVFNMATDTSLTVSNAPDITFGTSALTLTTPSATIDFGSTQAKTFGDLAFKKHAGNFPYIITGIGNTFGAVTQETPDATYQFNSVSWPSNADHNHVLSYNVTGHADYDCYIQSSSAGSPAHLVDSDGAGTNVFVNCTIKDMHVS